MIYLLALASIALGAVAQLLLKQGAVALSMVPGVPLLAAMPRLALQPLLLAGFACYSASALLWVGVLGKLRLSVAYPMASLGYVLVMAFSAWLLHEPIRDTQLIGLGLILLGVFLVAK